MDVIHSLGNTVYLCDVSLDSELYLPASTLAPTTHPPLLHRMK